MLKNTHSSSFSAASSFAESALQNGPAAAEAQSHAISQHSSQARDASADRQPLAPSSDGVDLASSSSGATRWGRKTQHNISTPQTGCIAALAVHNAQANDDSGSTMAPSLPPAAVDTPLLNKSKKQVRFSDNEPSDNHTMQKSALRPLAPRSASGSVASTSCASSASAKYESRPTLTRAGLRAWQLATLSSSERKHRQKLVSYLLSIPCLDPSPTQTDALRFKGDLRLNNIRATELPPGLYVSGHLCIRNCPMLMRLPDDLTVEGNLDCTQCPRLERLSADFVVGGDLTVSRCQDFEYAPRRLQVSGRTMFDACPSLKALPSAVEVEGHLHISSCNALSELPLSLQIKGDLYVTACPLVEQLAEDLRVGGDMFVFDCRRLTRLAQTLTVDGDLSCLKCPTLWQLPQQINIGKNLRMEKCASLTAIPNELTSWGRGSNADVRRISFASSGLSENIRLRLEQSEPSGIKFVFSEHLERFEIRGESRLPDLDSAARFWRQISYNHFVPNFAAWEDVSEHEQDLLCRFLSRIYDAADNTPQAQMHLVWDVCELLQVMDESSALRRRCLDILSSTISESGYRYRLMWAFDQMELAARISRAQQGKFDEATLKDLVLGQMRLEIVQSCAQQKAQALVYAEKLEVYSTYESQLRESLNLPLQEQLRSLPRCSLVSQQDLVQAQQMVRDAMLDQARVNAYLQNSPLWGRHQRQQQATRWLRNFTSHNLWPEKQITRLENLICPLTYLSLHELKQPVAFVAADDTCKLYEASELLKWWVNFDCDFLGSDFKLDAVKRVIVETEQPPAKRRRLH